MAKKKVEETTEEVKPKRKYHRVPKEYKEFDEVIVNASNKMQEYINVLKNMLEDYNPADRINKDVWERIKTIVVDVTELLKDAENTFIRKDPDEVKKQRYHNSPTLLYMVHERQRIDFVKDYIDKYETSDKEKDPEKYRIYYAWQIYGHLYFYLTERDKI